MVAGIINVIQRNEMIGPFPARTQLAQPNAILAVITAVLSATVSALGPHLPQQSRAALTLLPAAFTLFLAWRLASGVVLYWAASTAVSGLEGLLLRRGES